MKKTQTHEESENCWVEFIDFEWICQECKNLKKVLSLLG